MTIDELDAWIRLLAARIHERAAELTALDRAIGDGDHGINMDRGFAAVVTAMDAAVTAGTPVGAGTTSLAVILRALADSLGG